MKVCRSEMSVALYSQSDPSLKLIISARDGGAVTFLISGESPITIERFMYATEYRDAFDFIDAIVEALEENEEMSHNDVKKFVLSMTNLMRENYVQQNRLISIPLNGNFNQISDLIDISKLDDIHIYLCSWSNDEYADGCHCQVVIPEYQYHSFLEDLNAVNDLIDPDKITYRQPIYFDSDENFVENVLSRPDIGSRLLN